MSEKSLMIVNANLNPSEQEAFAYYSKNSTPIFKNAGGILVSKYKVSETIIGHDKTQIVVVMEFPNDDAIKNVINSEEYKSLLPYRDKAFSTLNVHIGN